MPDGKPNILVIWGDDIGITNLSCYSDGLMGYRTPNIDRIAAVMIETFAADPLFAGIDQLVTHFTNLAKDKCETLRTDSNLFDVWAEFVLSSERLAAFTPHLPDNPEPATLRRAADGMRLILQGRDLLNYISRARVTMPKTRREYFERCEHYARILAGLDSPQTPEWLSAP